MPIGIILFLTFFIGTWTAMHYYVFVNLAALGIDRTWLTAGLWALALAFPVARGLAFKWRAWPLRILYWIGALWMGAIFLFCFWFLVASGARRLLGLAGIGSESDPVTWIGTVAAAVAAMVAWGALHAWRGPKNAHYAVDRSGRYGGGRKARIVQISDVHLGLILGTEFLAAREEHINGLAPDLVLITGDLFDPEFPDDAKAVAELSRLRAREGIFAVSGNHEFYSGMKRYFAMMKDAGIPVLDSEVRSTAAGIQVCGIHDHTANRFTVLGLESDLGKALNGIDPARPSILLAHQPKGLEPAAAARVDLIFSGHTHAGQIFPFWAVVRMAFRYISGRYRIGADTDLIVNTGTGFWGPPLRLGTDSQIVVVDLSY
jgi:predicted MPP superfamily phosphohydrolase